MTRASRKRRTQAKARKARIEAQSQLRQGTRANTIAGLKVAWRGIAWGWKALGVTLVVLGAVSQAYFFIWRVSVAPSETLPQSDPVINMFILKNEGQFSINSVEFGCVINRAEYEDNLVFTENLVGIDEFNVPYLDGSGETSAACYLPGKIYPKLKTLILTVVVSYRPSFFPFRREKRFTFLARPKEDGSFVWYPMAK